MVRRGKYLYHKNSALPENQLWYIFAFKSNLKGAHDSKHCARIRL